MKEIVVAESSDRARDIERAHEAIDACARQLGLVEVDLVVGEEPEEGVEVGVFACMPCSANVPHVAGHPCWASERRIAAFFAPRK